MTVLKGSIKQQVRHIISELKDEGKWDGERTCSGAMWDEIKDLPTSDTRIEGNLKGFLTNFCNNGCENCQLYMDIEAVVYPEFRITVEGRVLRNNVFELVPFGYYMDNFLKEAKTYITDDRNRNHVLFKLLHEVNKEYNPATGTVWSDKHIERMLMFVEKPNLSTLEAVNTMLSYWNDVANAFHDALYDRYPTKDGECVESLLFCLVEAEDTLQKLLRTSKKLGIDPVAVLDECGTFGDGDDYEEKHVVTMKETDRTQLVDFLETQIEIHEDLHDVSDSVFTETMMNILRDLKNVFGSEEVDG